MSNESRSPQSNLVSRQLLIAQFRQRYPMGALVTDLLTIHQGEYVVRSQVQIGGTVWSTGMAAASRVEIAEDLAQERALLLLGLEPERQDVSLGEARSPALTPPQSLTYATVGLESIGLADSSPGNETPQTPRASVPEPPVLDVPSLDVPSIDDLSKETPSMPSGLPTQDGSESFQALDLLQALEPSPPPLKEFAEELTNEPLPEPPALAATLPEETPADPAPTKKAKLSKATKSKDVEPPTPESQEAQDYSDIIAKIDVEMMRLGWNATKGREHLKAVYGKRSRQQLSYPELLDFLSYLETQA